MIVVRVCSVLARRLSGGYTVTVLVAVTTGVDAIDSDGCDEWPDVAPSGATCAAQARRTKALDPLPRSASRLDILEGSPPKPRAVRSRDTRWHLVSSNPTSEVKFERCSGAQTSPCRLSDPRMTEPVSEDRAHGHRAGLRQARTVAPQLSHVECLADATQGPIGLNGGHLRPPHQRVDVWARNFSNLLATKCGRDEVINTVLVTGLCAWLVMPLGRSLMNLPHNSLTIGALRASTLSCPGSPPRRTSASQSCARDRACSTVSSPNCPIAGLRNTPKFGRYWSMNTLRSFGFSCT